MFNIAEYRKKPDRITDLLPWAALIAPGVVLNKDGSYQRTLRFRGPDLESSTDAELVATTARLNNALKRLGSGWALYIEARRSQAQRYSEESRFEDPVSWLVDLERHELFKRGGENFESHYYLTLQFMPPSEAVGKLSEAMIKRESDGQAVKNKKLSQKKQVKQKAAQAEKLDSYQSQLSFFNVSCERLFDIIKDFMFDAGFLDDDQTLTYLHQCISEKEHPVKKPQIPVYLDAILADTPLLAGLEPQLGQSHLRTVSILGFPSTSAPALLDQLNHLPIEYRWVTRFLPLDKTEAEKELKAYRKRWFAKRKGLGSMLMEMMTKSESAMVDQASVNKSRDADQAIQELEDDHVAFGYYTATITVWDKDPQVVTQKIREVERVVNGLGFTTILETLNAVEAWLSSLPGHANANIRAPLMHTLNLAHLIPFSAIWAGPERNQHLNGPPLLHARTRGNTPFRLVNHIGDVGHQMVLGPTGAGKSVLLNLMALQFRRYQDAQVFIFDKGGSFLASTLGVGGHYYEVGQPENKDLVFQPLAHVDKEAERIWATEWLLGLLQHEKVEVTPHVKDMLWQAMTGLAAVPENQRTLTGLKALLQDHQLRQALDHYTLGGPYGDILDADHELFTTGAWQCFDLEALMETPAIIPPVLDYIFHVLQQRFTGVPSLLILDEAWLFLDHPIFAAKIREWLKTLRKLNVSVIFTTQSVDDILESEITNSLLESCPSRIFLPNNRALEPSVYSAYEQLGLNARQIQMLSSAMPKRQYYYESTQGNCMFDLSLGPIALAFAGVSRPEDKQKIHALYRRYEYREFIEHYLRECHLDWAISLLEQWSPL
ncbi:Type IV secretion system protein virB4 [Piscirickettsia salmonis]|uniref:conjugal transfer protein TrbE n=1 Tax=Piscirickettsia salmonis TaxID=1238 RepID=UPI0012B90363|nr:conjugal transfer protein TrbE [Piscirickettsia salmonis]QGP51929.1 Type IV secretion system protein virB4 [Piscirickettsia salmonis]